MEQDIIAFAPSITAKLRASIKRQIEDSYSGKHHIRHILFALKNC
jgi:hypothetical protein